MEAKKTYVEVIAKFDADGNISPLSVLWKDGMKYEIRKVKDVRPAASMKAGGVGMRYTVLINNTETYLYQEEQRWFVEEKQNR